MFPLSYYRIFKKHGKSRWFAKKDICKDSDDISWFTYMLIKNVKGFALKSRGKIAAKNNGTLEMYYAE